VPNRRTPDQVALRNKREARYYRANLEKVKARHKKWREDNPDKVMTNNLKRYGLTYDEYWHMAATQGNMCAVCKKVETVQVKGKVARLGVDHNHTTGTVRKLLCARCNTVIGLVEEDVLLLESMVAYIRGHN
jgi:diketogulonate reductase-like aldo/keto reductase